MSFFFKYLYALISIQILVHAAHFNEHEYNLQKWNSFKKQFDKKYESSEEDQHRMKIYLDNLDEITKHNERFKKGEVSYIKGITLFSDLTLREFTELYLTDIDPSPISNETISTSLPPNLGPPLESMDWTTKGAVTSVKDQGNCGCKCCWAFAATAAIESHNFIIHHQLVELSEQYLIDCMAAFGTGGSVNKAFEFVKKNHGIPTERSYPFQCQKNENCNKGKLMKKITIKSFKPLNHKDETTLKTIVGAVGPVTASINATKLHTYVAGTIVNGENCPNAPGTDNHDVLIVGYGRDKHEKQDYWLVKNSWGREWGDNGYFKIARNSGNTCGIVNRNFYPEIK